MSVTVKRTFRFNIPSVFPLDWVFEFHCDLQFDETQQVAVDIKEHTIGRVQLKVKDCGVTWKSLLWTWHQCYKLAFNHVCEWNAKDDATRRAKRINERGMGG